MAFRFLIWFGLLACVIAGVVAFFKRVGKPVVVRPDSPFERLLVSTFASQAPWFGLFGSPVCMGIVLGIWTQLESAAQGVHLFYFYSLLFITLTGVLLSLLGMDGAIRSGRKVLLTVSILGLILNGIVGLQLLAMALLNLVSTAGNMAGLWSGVSGVLSMDS